MTDTYLHRLGDGFTSLSEKVGRLEVFLHKCATEPGHVDEKKFELLIQQLKFMNGYLATLQALIDNEQA